MVLFLGGVAGNTVFAHGGMTLYIGLGVDVAVADVPEGLLMLGVGS